MEILLFAIAWVACGAVAGQMLSYPNDGINARHFLGAALGPVAMFLSLLAWAFLD